MFPSSAFWAEMTLAKRWVLERNHRRRKMSRVSPLGEDFFGLTPFFGFRGGDMTIEVPDEGEGMCSCEDMGVKVKRRRSDYGATAQQRSQFINCSVTLFHSPPPFVTTVVRVVHSGSDCLP